MNRPVIYRFRLYVSGSNENSAAALVNLNTICARCLPDRHEIEVVDVIRNPHRALTDGIQMTPTLVKLGPPPLRKIVGTLSQIKRVMLALDVTDVRAPA
jgi:circadian clock protein KaiB